MSVKSVAGADDQLMDEVSAGSVAAFAELYDRYCDRAYRVALSVCRDDGRAQDAVQEAFLAIWQSRASYHAHRGTTTAWLLTVVRHRTIDLARKNGRHAGRRASQDQLKTLTAPDDVSEQAIEREDTDRLHAALGQLPAAQQEVITLAFYGQLSHTEIATQLRLPSGTVKGRMRLGLEKLRAAIELPDPPSPSPTPTPPRSAPGCLAQPAARAVADEALTRTGRPAPPQRPPSTP